MNDYKFDRGAFAEPWLKFLDEFGESPALPGTLEDIFEGWEVVLGKIVAEYDLPPPGEGVKIRQHDLDGFWIRSYTPPDTTGQEPLGCYFHGGVG